MQNYLRRSTEKARRISRSIYAAISGNCTPFGRNMHIPRLSTAFSVKLIPFSAKTTNILLLFTFPFYTITETPDFCVKVYFCLIVRFFPLSPSYQRHLKTRKNGVHQPSSEPHQALKPLILSHSSILLHASTKILWHYFFIAAWAAVKYCSWKNALISAFQILSLKFAPKVSLGCIVSNCGTQARLKNREKLCHAPQPGHCLAIVDVYFYS